MKFFSLVATGAIAGSPVTKVVELVSKLEQDVIREGKAEQKAYEAFAEWCEDESVRLKYDIKTGKASAETLGAVIEKATADMASYSAKIEELSAATAENEAAIAKAEKLRADEHASFQKESNELKSTIDMLHRAHSVLRKSVGSVDANFAQVQSSLEAIIHASSLAGSRTKSQLQALLQSDEDSEGGINAPSVKAYESHSGKILDIIEGMQEKAEDMLAEVQKTEMTNQHNFEMVHQSLSNAIKYADEDLSQAKSQKASAAQAKAEAEGEKSKVDSDLTSDKKVLADTHISCTQKAKDWEVSSVAREEELKVLAEAKKIIAEQTGGANARQYDALMQVSDDESNVVTDVSLRVARSIRTLASNFSEDGVALNQLSTNIRATAGTAGVFDKVTGLIKSMITKLEDDMAADAKEKAFCDKETAESEAKRDRHQETVDKLTAKIDGASARIAKLTEQVATLTGELAEIAKAKAKAEELRRNEHEEFVIAQKDFSEGVQGIEMALKILRDYYAQETPSFIQQPAVSVHSKGTDAASGIIGLLEVAQSDFARSLSEVQANEDSAQSEFDQFIQDSKIAATTKSKDVEYKQREAKQLQKTVSEAEGDREGVQVELDSVNEYLSSLRERCVAKPISYEERKARREREIEGLKQALQILSEESSSTQFVQIRARRFRGSH